MDNEKHNTSAIRYFLEVTTGETFVIPVSAPFFVLGLSLCGHFQVFFSFPTLQTVVFT
jgi:hypothetical protein